MSKKRKLEAPLNNPDPYFRSPTKKQKITAEDYTPDKPCVDHLNELAQNIDDTVLCDPKKLTDEEKATKLYEHLDSTAVEVVDFTCAGLTGRGALLAAKIIINFDVNTFNVCANHLGKYSTAVAWMVASKNSSVHTFNMQENNIDGPYAVEVARLIANKDSSVHTFSIKTNNIDGPYAVEVARLIASEDSSVRTFSIEDNNIDGPYAVEVARLIASEDSSVRTFDIGTNGLDLNSCYQIAQLITRKNSPVKALLMDCNWYSDEDDTYEVVRNVFTQHNQNTRSSNKALKQEIENANYITTVPLDLIKLIGEFAVEEFIDFTAMPFDMDA